MSGVTDNFSKGNIVPTKCPPSLKLFNDASNIDSALKIAML